MNDAIYLSVGRPDQSNLSNDEFMEALVNVNSAISAFIEVFLGRRSLVWAGHPDVTLQLKSFSEEFDVDYSKWVKVYHPRMKQTEQSESPFHAESCSDNVTFVDATDELSDSFFDVRRKMFDDYNFTHAVFIGGGERAVEEYELLKESQPDAKIIPIISTAGATIEIARRLNLNSNDLKRKDKYIKLFYKKLEIEPGEPRKKYPLPQVNTLTADTIKLLQEDSLIKNDQIVELFNNAWSIQKDNKVIEKFLLRTNNQFVWEEDTVENIEKDNSEFYKALKVFSANENDKNRSKSLVVISDQVSDSYSFSNNNFGNTKRRFNYKRPEIPRLLIYPIISKSGLIEKDIKQGWFNE